MSASSAHSKDKSREGFRLVMMAASSACKLSIRPQAWTLHCLCNALHRLQQLAAGRLSKWQTWCALAHGPTTSQSAANQEGYFQNPLLVDQSMQ